MYSYLWDTILGTVGFQRRASGAEPDPSLTQFFPTFRHEPSGRGELSLENSLANLSKSRMVPKSIEARVDVQPD